MATRFVFQVTHSYADKTEGIAVPVVLISGPREAELTAIIDTGASHSVFERSYGVVLGLNVEAGLRQDFRTATGRFVADGHELTISTLGMTLMRRVLLCG